jgi:hypothetical protein
MMIDGKEYQLVNTDNTDKKTYVVIRSRDSGCHAGYLESEEGDTITLINARRLWYWEGAATLSQLAEEGVKTPEKCKFPCAVSRITVYGCCEKIAASLDCRKSIEGVPLWTA